MPVFSASNGLRHGVSGILFSVSFVSTSLVMSSVGLGGGVVAIVQPIHAPMPTTANWGMLNPGDVANYTLYVKNNGTQSVTLSMGTSNWSPQAASGN